MFSVFFLPGILTQYSGMSRNAFDSITFNLAIIVTSIPQILLLLFVVEIQDPETKFGFSFSLRQTPVRMLAVAVGLFVIAYSTSSVIEMIQSRSFSLRAGGEQWTLTHTTMIPVILVSSLSVGYREEMFFRAYLVTRLEQIGLSDWIVVTTSTLLFSVGHLYEGLGGFLVACTTGLYLALVYRARRNVHEIAVAHGLYNFAILLLSGVTGIA